MSPDLAAEAELVARAQADPEAFGELYRRHHSRLYRYIWSRTKDAMLAEDLTSDVFLLALRGIGAYRPQGRPFAAWLFRIAINRIADHYGARRWDAGPVDALLALERDPRVTEDVAVERGLVAIVREALDAVPRRQRVALVLHHVWGMTHAQTAVAMGTTELAVKLLVHRGVAGVRRHLAEVEAAA